ncbi:Vitamin B12 transporter BtuB [Paraglaciecola mesophila]|uniref:Vitamin B12 transporter BtuB n=1 Tax=Paraglaciecola mesophila TaxID=197222 RepID=A0A857JJ34_9ALTE|nr:TonB-dependent receptor [Paraglaciecola mesophila]QHJ11312.1 Vitamin B12 transporter BtuB [Paraglaciecola mesophila]
MKTNTRHIGLLKNTAIALAVAQSLAGGSAFAQSASSDENSVEVIEVKGIRASLSQSLNKKKNSDEVLDSIVAEDIGKFPDTNVAESLQRIPGVSIDRAGGEGAQVTVRGFGPSFNSVLVGGRRLATDTAGRNFRFDLLGAELIGGADVYKTAPSHLQAGGIGSTIDLQLQRPLSIGEQKTVLSTRAVYEDNSGDVAPQFFGLFSDTFNDDTIGALVSLSYQKRKSAQDAVFSGPFVGPEIDQDQASVLFADGVGNGSGRYLHQQQLRFARQDQQRDRIGLTGVFQYQFADNALLTVDGLFSDFDITNQTTHIFMFNERATYNNAVTDENNILVAWDQIGRPFQAAVEDNRASQVWQVGANLDWDISDNFSAVFDVSYSEAEDDSAGDDFFFVVAGPQAVQRFDYTQGGDAPIFQNFEFELATTDLNGDGEINSLDRVVGNEIVAPDPNDTFSWFGTREGQGSTDEVFELRSDFEWYVDAGVLENITFGAYYADQEKTRSDARTPGGGNGINNAYLQAQIPLPAELFSLQNNSNFLDAINANAPSQYLAYDPEKVIAYLESDEALTQRDLLNNLPLGTSATRLGLDPANPRADGGVGFNAIDVPRNAFIIGEETIAVYANAKLTGEVADMGLTVNLGFRYTQTETTSEAFSEPFATIFPDPTRPDVLLSTRLPAQFIEQTEDYNEFLPSITAKLNVTDEVVVRASYSKSLTRPNLADLNPGINTAPELRLSDLTATSGNPDLNPFVSDNIDLSVEYYFADASAISAGFFRKDVSAFIAQQEMREGLTLPAGNRLDEVTEDRSNIEGDTIFLNINRPRNLNSTVVDGVEISFQHVFDTLPGLLQYVGVSANLTYVNSDDEVNNDLIDAAVALPGLGDSQNFVVYYDDGTIEARLAYNNRDRFFDGRQGAEPIFTERFDQIDARIAWNIGENYQVFVEGTNLTNSFVKRAGRFESRFGGIEDPGARYVLGARATF